MARVLLTGASGRIAQALRPALIEGGQVRLYTRSPITETIDGEEVFHGRLEDLDSVVTACDDVSTVVHLGGISDEADFDRIVDANVVGTYNVFEAARRCGVRRVVFASTHHVTGFYPTDAVLDETASPRPDTLYAVSKVFGESVGRLYHDKWGMEVVCLRIGACRGEPENADQLRTWLSTPDCVRLIVTAVRNEVPAGFAIVYGVSDNSRSFWDASSARDLGFAPRDAADDFDDRFPSCDRFSSPWQGGMYTDPDYRGRQTEA
jgi:uronate dehydrogenase